MKKTFAFGILLLIAFASAAIYQEPWSQNQLGDQHNLSDMDYISANFFNGTLTGEVTGSMNWTKLQNFPAACPGSSAITQLNGSVTCSDLWLDISGNETMTGNFNMGLNNITNATEISSTLIDTTNLEADNLESNLDGTGYNITASCIIFDSGGSICSGS